MKVYIEKTNEHIDIKAKSVKELLDKLKINPTTVLVSRNNKLVSGDIKVNENDEVKIISVVSGG